MVLPKKKKKKNGQGQGKIYTTQTRSLRNIVIILTSDKTDFKIRSITGDREGYFVMMKGSIHKKSSF